MYNLIPKVNLDVKYLFTRSGNPSVDSELLFSSVSKALKLVVHPLDK